MSERQPFGGDYEPIDVSATRYLEGYTNAATLVAETLDGHLKTEFVLDFDGHELYGEKGEAMETVFDKGIADAEYVASLRPNLYFEVPRRYKDREEYIDMLAMARYELPNTMIVVSDFPEELMDSPVDVGGYNTARKQTFVRVIIHQTDGSLRLISQTLDQSNRVGLEAIYGLFGTQAKPGQLLGQRIHIGLTADQQQTVVDDIRRVYDASLELQNPGQEFLAGRLREESPAETYAFVIAQTGLLDAYVTQVNAVGNRAEKEWLRYSFAAAMAERYHLRSLLSFEEAHLGMDYYITEMQRAGSAASSAGKRFNACGITMANLEEQMKQSGYGNQTDETTEYAFSKRMFCVKCQKPPKKAAVKKLCGPCGICKSCDLKLSTPTKVISI
jgi:hypothetical protein